MTDRLTAGNLASAVSRLSKSQWFDYIVQKSNSSQVRIKSVTLPEGPIVLLRKTADGAQQEVSIPTAALWRVAGAIEPGVPFQIDRILGASYNFRALLETLLAHTRDFYWCRPGRIQRVGQVEELKEGHKNLIWLPHLPHEDGRLREHLVANDLVIVETPHTVIHEGIGIYVPEEDDELNEFDSCAKPTDKDEIEYSEAEFRRHVQIQLALAEIGDNLGYQSWIAANDRNHKYRDGRIADLPYVIGSLNDVDVLSSFPNAQLKAKFVDILWFGNRTIPLIAEVEHSTGVTSGLDRMLAFQQQAPPLANMRFVIVAPDSARSEVVRKAAEPHFRPLEPRFMPYSAVEELLSLCRTRKISSANVLPVFIDLFLEIV